MSDRAGIFGKSGGKCGGRIGGKVGLEEGRAWVKAENEVVPEAGVAAEGVPRAGDAHRTKKVLGIKTKGKGG